MLRTASAILLSLGLFAFPAAAVAAEAAEATPHDHCMEAMARHFRRQHMDLARFDRTKACAEYAQKAASGFPPQFLMGWLGQEIKKIEFAYAPPGARHQPGVRYRWPFEAWIPRLVTQTSAGPTHSTPEEQFAIDFLMPGGSAVLAARKGRVVDVRDGTPAGTSYEQDAGNGVAILHEDGTFAFYGHLQKGIPVTVGQEVEAGDRIAASGNTGFSFTPHLHFVVRRAIMPGEIRAVPIRFGRTTDRGIVPKPGHHWGNLPRRYRELRVAIDGRPVSKGEVLPVVYGSERALRVELLGADGSVSDVTESERTRYETMTLWNLHSPERGRIRIAAVPGIKAKYIEEAKALLDRSAAQLFIYHGEPGELDFGMAQLTFQVALEAAPE